MPPLNNEQLAKQVSALSSKLDAEISGRASADTLLSIRLDAHDEAFTVTTTELVEVIARVAKLEAAIPDAPPTNPPTTPPTVPPNTVPPTTPPTVPPNPPVVPLPPPPVLPPIAKFPSLATSSGTFKLASGTFDGNEISMADCLGGMCVDDANNLYVVAAHKHHCVLKYNLPDPSTWYTGPDKNAGHVLYPVEMIPAPWNVHYPGVFPISGAINDVAWIDGKLRFMHRLIYDQPTGDVLREAFGDPVNRLRYFASDGEVTQVAGEYVEGQGCGFVRRRDRRKPYAGCTGATSNPGIAGNSVIDMDTGRAILLPGWWAGSDGEGQVRIDRTWNERMYRPPDTWMQGWTPTNPAGSIAEDAGYVYAFNPRLAGGQPQNPTEEALLLACLEHPGDMTRAGVYADYLEEKGWPNEAALVRKWGPWVQKWCAEQGNGGGLWFEGLGARFIMQTGCGEQNYNFHKVTPERPQFMAVSFALQMRVRAAAYSLRTDGTLDPQPEWEDTRFGKVHGSEWAPNGDMLICETFGCVDPVNWWQTAATHPVVHVFKV